MEDHEMHAEYIDVRNSLIEKLRDCFVVRATNKNADQNIIAVGTTSLRTLESLYWMGAKIIAANSGVNRGANIANNTPLTLDNLAVEQWDPYTFTEQGNLPNTAAALDALASWLNQNKLERLLTKTQIIIAPGYRFKIIDGLITNFHQPQSTLLLLVAAITNGNWKPIYQYALENDFRFLSYGDGCLIWLDPFAR
jgi:S-adenosylmethionine:tRNA ribosyltransferase-isomerase